MLLIAGLPSSLLSGRAARAPHRARASAAYVDLEMEVAGVAEALRLSSPEDPARIAAELAAKNNYDAADEAEIAAILTLRWLEIYAGPEAADLQGVVANVELPAVGLALTVADSTVEGAGKGLFINCLEGVGSVTLEAGTAVCGYADGGFCDADSGGGKTVAFALKNPDTSVFFDKELWTVAELLERDDSGVDAIAGHSFESGVLSLDGSYRNRYYVPDAAQQEFSVMNIGCMANDLADINSGDALDATADYGERSDARNALVLVQRLERDADDPFVLNPSRPITTLRSRTVFCNARPMELGCEYGERFWMSYSDEF